MGMTTFMYGVIKEYGLDRKRLAEVYSHNEEIISGLPTSGPWPPLSREMFSITKNVNKIVRPPAYRHKVLEVDVRELILSIVK